MTNCLVHPSNNLLKNQVLSIPGDKSISHRAVMIGSLAKGEYKFTNFLFSEDCLHTIEIFKLLGINITADTIKKEVLIQGKGLWGLTPAKQTLDVGNSGTLIRLITGVLAAQNFTSTITGDESIQTRPMKRVITPLSLMNANITGQSGTTDTLPPLTIYGNPKLQPIHYTLPMASAQVKSAILLAGLYCQGTTIITEPTPCRDHTERMLQLFGADLTVNQTQIKLTGAKELSSNLKEITIPSDLSSAAFFIILGLINKNCQFTLKQIGLNPTRNRLLQVLQQMGANISIQNQDQTYFEPMGDLLITSSNLNNITINPADIPNLIDEIPILAVAALFGKGIFKITNAQELRVKESDRIKAIVQSITAMGGTITEYPDGFEIIGNEGKIQDFEIDSFGDHRIAMSAIIAAIASNKQATIKNCACIATSFPNFFELLNSLQANVTLID
jgi:3-phosphoshikimate 1-carboxyvinyltransferase